MLVFLALFIYAGPFRGVRRGGFFLKLNEPARPVAGPAGGPRRVLASHGNGRSRQRADSEQRAESEGWRGECAMTLGTGPAKSGGTLMRRRGRAGLGGPGACAELEGAGRTGIVLEGEQ